MSFLKTLFGATKVSQSVSAAKDNLKKLEKKDQLEAMVGACLLVSAADGKVDDGEVLKMNEILESLPAVSHFGSLIGETVDRFHKQLKAGFLIGKVQIMREIADCKHSETEAEDILVAAITVALGDGELDAKEQDILKEIAQKLGLSLAKYGI